MNKVVIALCVFLVGSVCKSRGQSSSGKYPLGYSVDIGKITSEKMQYAKSLGITHIELAGIGAILDKKLDTIEVSVKWKDHIQSVKTILANSGIKVWSIHMPFSQNFDISLTNEARRQRVVAAHRNILKALLVLSPEIILFHPSYYLGLNEREARAKQMTKSVNELYKIVSGYKRQMVVENMLGPALRKGDVERPLMRSVEECQKLFSNFPGKVGIGVDMCHIAEPQKLLLAFGSRVKTVHVSNGTGEAENHYLPCDARGKNDWNAIFAALQKIKYKGPFMHESKYKDEKELAECYNSIWENYQVSLTKKK
ncbi:sugar phosphate isomerase/epimerase family protein [Desertivirga xinjiangensis]|uniref:sugar phosphate isomerase/epimerase family protein n=1 Tax=Desertivirga xinjiangensis TaxID=539206 RepID=UPI002109AB7F|nr:TIM barrel protein [Pedobacter xinjiangensis]